MIKTRDIESNKRKAWVERVIFYGAVILAIILVVSGFCLAGKTGDYHWVNRFGAAVVAAEAVILILDYYCRRRFEKTLKSAKGNRELVDALEKEIDIAERNLFFLIVALMVVGQMLHGFGDVIYSLQKQLINSVFEVFYAGV